MFCCLMGIGAAAVVWDSLIHGVRLMIFIISLPQGILGSLQGALRRIPARAPA